MKVRIVSGNQKGTVIDMPQSEAEAALSTGFAEFYDPAKDKAAAEAEQPAPKSKGKASKKAATSKATKRKK